MSEEQYDNIGQKLMASDGISLSRMFGKPCFKSANKKAFAAFFKGEMVFKLGQEEVELLKKKYPGAMNWDPSGKNRPMKDWLQVPATFAGDWEVLAKEALFYIEKV